MKEYSFTKLYKGIQFHCLVVASKSADVEKLFNVSAYFVRTYMHRYEPKTQVAIENHYQRYVVFEHSGETGYFLPKHLLNVPIKYNEAIQIIDEHRKVYPTRWHTEKHFKTKQ